MSTIASLVLPAAIPSPDEQFSRFQLGPFSIHAYALCILLGIVVAVWLTLRRWRARGGDPDVIWDVAIWAIPLGIIGGRLYHVVTSPDAYFGPNYDGTGDPIKILYIWNGGLGIWGAVALGAVGAWIGARRHGVRLSAVADATVPGVLLAQAIGRWGNWFNQELFGRPTTLPWGLRIDPSSPNFPAGDAAGTLFHPTFLYECLWDVLCVVVLLLLDRKLRLRFGQLTWMYVALYTLGRTGIEALRIDEAQMITIGGVTARLNVWTSAVMFVLAVLILVFCALRARRQDPAAFMYLPGRAPEPAAGTEADEARAGHVPEPALAAATPGAGTAGGTTGTDGAQQEDAQPERSQPADSPPERSGPDGAEGATEPSIGRHAHAEAGESGSDAADAESPYPGAEDVLEEEPRREDGA